MRGLSQAGHLAHVDLVKHLAIFGHRPVNFSPGLWKHDNNAISFTLVVNDFWEKIFNMESLARFINALTQTYEIAINMDGDFHIGVALKWNHITN